MAGHFVTCFFHLGVNHAGVKSGAEHLEPLPGAFAQEGLGRLAARWIARADKETPAFSVHLPASLVARLLQSGAAAFLNGSGGLP